MALPTLRRPLATALAAMLLTSCGGKMPTEPSRLCRRYPTAFTENGLSYNCSLESTATGRKSSFIEDDLIEYSAWDSQGRPTSGTLHVGDNAQPVTIAYDDRARQMEASNGEAVTRNANGNVVRDVIVLGLGAASVFSYTIQSTAEVCL